MKLLLDTHILFWWVVEDRQLSTAAKAAISDKANIAFVSMGSVWEMAIKVGNGRWPEAKPLLDNFERELEVAKLHLLPIGVVHVRAAGLMKSQHRDPFDRLLAAQAMAEGLTLVTADAALAELGATCLW